MFTDIIIVKMYSHIRKIIQILTKETNLTT